MKEEGSKDLKYNLKERTFSYARRIIRLYSALPKTALKNVLGNQLLRSGTSVGANYREADRARSKAEFIAKMGDCLKELAETEYWLELISAEELFPRKKLESLQEETNQLISIFNAIIQKTKKK